MTDTMVYLKGVLIILGGSVWIAFFNFFWNKITGIWLMEEGEYGLFAAILFPFIFPLIVYLVLFIFPFIVGKLC